MTSICVHVLRDKLEDGMADQAIRELCQSARSRRLVLFFGAGVSREFPSLVPIAWPSVGIPAYLRTSRFGELHGIKSALVFLPRRRNSGRETGGFVKQ